MRIRSITCFIDPGWPVNSGIIKQAGDFIQAARPAIQSAGFEVQTTRLATIPFGQVVPAAQGVELAATLHQLASNEGFEHLALGPASGSQLEYFAVIPDILAVADNIFVTGEMTSSGSISLPAVRACAMVIKKAAGLTPDGFANLRFCALANVPAGMPFFPAAYSPGKRPGFALAMEAAELAVSAFSQAVSIVEARDKLRHSIEISAGRLATICQSLAASHAQKFYGLDFTLAPFPELERSIGTAIERIGVPAIGLAGSLAASAILAEALDRADYPRTGFNGLMLPVLEDFTLAARAADGLLSVNDLLLYSTVCGTGLDCIPLPGDINEASLAAILLDLAALALRLNKPLTARLMPVPGKKSGDATAFDFAYFANSRIMSLPAAPLEGLLAGNETFELKARQR